MPTAELEFRYTCMMGLEGILSKRLSKPVRPVGALTEAQEPGQPGDGEASGGAMVMISW
jgi:hypothetical protein